MQFSAAKLRSLCKKPQYRRFLGRTLLCFTSQCFQCSKKLSSCGFIILLDVGYCQLCLSPHHHTIFLVEILQIEFTSIWFMSSIWFAKANNIKERNNYLILCFTWTYLCEWLITTDHRIGYQMLCCCSFRWDERVLINTMKTVSLCELTLIQVYAYQINFKDLWYNNNKLAFIMRLCQRIQSAYKQTKIYKYNEQK